MDTADIGTLADQATAAIDQIIAILQAEGPDPADVIAVLQGVFSTTYGPAASLSSLLTEAAGHLTGDAQELIEDVSGVPSDRVYKAVDRAARSL